MIWILKVYSNPKSVKQGFSVFPSESWDNECKFEKSQDVYNGCTCMSQHDSRREAIDEARKVLGIKKFNECF